MGMTLYSCITPIAQMSRNHLLFACWSWWLLVFSVNQYCHWGQSR